MNFVCPDVTGFNNAQYLSLARQLSVFLLSDGTATISNDCEKVVNHNLQWEVHNTLLVPYPVDFLAISGPFKTCSGGIVPLLMRASSIRK